MTPLSPLEESLKQTDVLSNQIVDILDAFDVRLDAIENAVLPFHDYLQTVKMIYENMESTSSVIDNLLKKLDFANELPDQLNSLQLTDLSELADPDPQLQSSPNMGPLPICLQRCHRLLRQLCLTLSDLHPIHMKSTQNALQTLTQLGQETLQRLENDAFVKLLSCSPSASSFSLSDSREEEEEEEEEKEGNLSHSLLDADHLKSLKSESTSFPSLASLPLEDATRRRKKRALSLKNMSFELQQDMKRIEQLLQEQFPYSLSQVHTLHYLVDILQEMALYQYASTQDRSRLSSDSVVFQSQMRALYSQARQNALRRLLQEATLQQQRFYDVIARGLFSLASANSTTARRDKPGFEMPFREVTVSLYLLSRVLGRERALAILVLPPALAPPIFDDIIGDSIDRVLRSHQSLITSTLLHPHSSMEPSHWLSSLLDLYTVLEETLWETLQEEQLLQGVSEEVHRVVGGRVCRTITIYRHQLIQQYYRLLLQQCPFRGFPMLNAVFCERARLSVLLLIHHQMDTSPPFIFSSSSDSSSDESTEMRMRPSTSSTTSSDSRKATKKTRQKKEKQNNKKTQKWRALFGRKELNTGQTVPRSTTESSMDSMIASTHKSNENEAIGSSADAVIRHLLVTLFQQWMTERENNIQSTASVMRKDEVGVLLSAMIQEDDVLLGFERHVELSEFLKEERLEEPIRARREEKMRVLETMMAGFARSVDTVLQSSATPQRIKEALTLYHTQLEGFFARANAIKVESVALRVRLREKMQRIVDDYEEIERKARACQFSRHPDKHFLYQRDALQSLVKLAFEGG